MGVNRRERKENGREAATENKTTCTHIFNILTKKKKERKKKKEGRVPRAGRHPLSPPNAAVEVGQCCQI